MRSRQIFVVLFALAVIVAPGAASAQSAPAPKNLVVGFSFETAGPAVGGTGGIELPWRDMGGGTMSIVAGVGYLRQSSNKFGFGAGVKFTRELNEKTRFFVTAVAGAVTHRSLTGSSTASFGVLPSGGIIYKLNEKRDFYVSVGPGVTRKFGFAYWGVVVTAGVIIPWG